MAETAVCRRHQFFEVNLERPKKSSIESALGSVLGVCSDGTVAVCVALEPRRLVEGSASVPSMTMACAAVGPVAVGCF